MSNAAQDKRRLQAAALTAGALAFQARRGGVDAVLHQPIVERRVGRRRGKPALRREVVVQKLAGDGAGHGREHVRREAALVLEPAVGVSNEEAFAGVL